MPGFRARAGRARSCSYGTFQAGPGLVGKFGFIKTGPVVGAMSEISLSYLSRTRKRVIPSDGCRVLRRAVTVYTYRALIQTTANRAGPPSRRRCKIADFDKIPPGERKVLVEQLAILEQEAARYGVSVGRFILIKFGDDEGESPSRH